MTDQEIQYLLRQLQNQFAGGGGTSFRNRQLFDRFGPSVPPALLRNAPVGSDLRPNAIPFTRPLMAASGNISGVMSTDTMSGMPDFSASINPDRIPAGGRGAGWITQADVKTANIEPPALAPGESSPLEITPESSRDIFARDALGRGITPMPADIYENVYGAPNPTPNETMFPTDQGFFPGDRPPDFGNINPTAPVTFSPNYFGDWGGGPANPSPNETMYPTDLGYFPQDQMPGYSSMPDYSNPMPNETMYPNESNNYINYDPTLPAFQEEPMPDFPNAPAGGGFDFTAPPAQDVNQWLQPIPTDFVSDPNAFQPNPATAPAATDYTTPTTPSYLTPPKATPTAQPPFGNMPSITTTLGPGLYVDPNNPSGKLVTDALGNIRDATGSFSLHR
jgi:hypothetical protein